jgi:hypothetical protein
MAPSLNSGHYTRAGRDTNRFCFEDMAEGAAKDAAMEDHGMDTDC